MGLIIPLIASATATFLFRQFYLTIPDELVDAPRSTARSPAFLWSVLLPTPPQHGRPFRGHVHLRWNQYLWPLMASSSDKMKSWSWESLPPSPAAPSPRSGTCHGRAMMALSRRFSLCCSCSGISCTDCWKPKNEFRAPDMKTPRHSCFFSSFSWSSEGR